MFPQRTRSRRWMLIDFFPFSPLLSPTLQALFVLSIILDRGKAADWTAVNKEVRHRLTGMCSVRPRNEYAILHCQWGWAHRANAGAPNTLCLLPWWHPMTHSGVDESRSFMKGVEQWR